MADARDRRQLSRQYGVGLVCFVGVVDAVVSATLALQLLDAPSVAAGLLRLGLVGGKLAAISGLLAGRRWGYEWMRRVYAASGLLNLVSLNLLGLVFDAVVLLQLAVRTTRVE